MKIINVFADRLLGRLAPSTTAKAEKCWYTCYDTRERYCCESANGEHTHCWNTGICSG